MIVIPRLCYGGAERVGVVLANGLARAGHEVTVVSNLLDPVTYELDADIDVLPLVSENRPAWRKWMSAARLLRRHVRNSRPDVVIGIMALCSLLARLAVVGLHIPVVATEHDAFDRPEGMSLSAYGYITKFWTNRLFSHVTVLTEADRRVIGRRLRRVSVMPNPLAAQPLKDVPAKRNVVLAAGRLYDWEYKGFDLLVEAWGRVAPAHPGWRLEIAGVGEEADRRRLLSWAAQWGVSGSVELLGFRSDIQDVMARSAVFCLSSRYEGFGLVLIEAMSQGCACVAADYRGRQSEIITRPEEGLTCAVGSADAIADALERIISDDDYRQRVQRAAIERSKFYAVGHVVQLWEKLLREVVRGNKSGLSELSHNS